METGAELSAYIVIALVSSPSLTWPSPTLGPPALVDALRGRRARKRSCERAAATMILIRHLRWRLRPLAALSGPSFSSLTASASAAAVEAERTIRDGPRNDWSRDEIKSIYDSPILDLLFHGSSRYDTGLKAQKLMNKDAVLEAAKKAKEAGSTRFCMGAAWRDTVGRKTNFNQILEYVSEIRAMGMEVCCTLGMLEKQQAEELKKAGLTAYNHNLDTSREYYPNIITTRSYDERLATLQHVREAGISPVEIWEMIRMIATARIVMPRAMVRLSAGRVRFSMPEQALCLLAGANSIFTGEKLLTTPNNDFDADQMMFKILGLTCKAPSFSEAEAALGPQTCEEAISSVR
ncbi:Biotin and thiamine Synthesis associated domain [Musa troglodytarum]|uniref:Biotin and thiamine Synthesis associated domain n=1 Tax=Musa troglodytarum TaxID=320322 RepID=A0A9E7JKF3_9LILI|nr:Biotin and thiamine Synthesis associated domain [Musa troglodytarum]